jgi:hypothetical protein
MTRIRVVGRLRRQAILIRAWLPLLIVAFAVGCGTPPQGASVTPSAEATASVTGSAQPGAKPTAWPGNAVIGIEAMGVADGQIAAGLNDLNRAIATEDLGLMRRAADGLAGTDVLLRNVDRIKGFEPMRSFAERYAAAVSAISSAATSLRSAIDAEDATAITTSSKALIAALGSYTDVQPDLAAWVEQSITQRRLLTQ